MYNLNLFHAEIVTRYGGSIRCGFQKKQKTKLKFKGLLSIEEDRLIKNKDKTYNKFIEKKKNQS